MRVLPIVLVCLAIAMLFVAGGSARSIVVPDFRNISVMDNRTLADELYEAYNTTPRLPNAPLEGAGPDAEIQSVNLLPFIPNVPSERNQGSTGTCWVWGHTGLLEGSHGYENGYLERLSTQYLVSRRVPYAGGGGMTGDFVNFYNSVGFAIPWNNTNASWQDGGCGKSGPTNVSYTDISTIPQFTLNGPIVPWVIMTTDDDEASQAQAVANIKASLNAGSPVYLAFYGERSYMNNFQYFWGNNASSLIYDFSSFGGVDADGSENVPGHGVTVVGYYDDGNPATSYWECLNSWYCPAGRPLGTFRIKMYMDYNAEIDPGLFYYNVPVTTWWTFTYGEDYNDRKAFVQESALPRAINISWQAREPATGNTTVVFDVTDWGYPTWGQFLFGDSASGEFNEPVVPKLGETHHLFSHSYTPGTYTPTYTSANANGTSAPFSYGNLVIDGIPPVAVFSYQNPSYCPWNEPEPSPKQFRVRFTDASHFVPTAWTWNFGDGSPEDHRRNPAHVYTAPGRYTVTLTAGNSYGTATTSRKIRVALETNCAHLVEGETRENRYAWYSFREPGEPRPCAEIVLRDLIASRIPVNLRASAVRQIEAIPVSAYIAGSALGAGRPDGGTVATDIIAGALPTPKLSLTELTLKPGVKKNVKASVETNGMAAGDYTFNVLVLDQKSKKTLYKVPVYFSINSSSRLQVTPPDQDMGTLTLESQKAGQFTLANPGNVKLTGHITAPPECVFPDYAGSSDFDFDVAEGGTLPVTFKVDTAYLGDLGFSGPASMRILADTNDPITPLREFPVNYTLNAPVAQFVSTNITDSIFMTEESPLTVNVTVRNVGPAPWDSTYTLGAPAFGDGRLFVRANADSAGPVGVGQNATYNMTLYPPPGTEDPYYRDYVLSFEMFYPDAYGNPVYFGSPIFRDVYFGPG